MPTNPSEKALSKKEELKLNTDRPLFAYESLEIKRIKEIAEEQKNEPKTQSKVSLAETTIKKLKTGGVLKNLGKIKINM